MGVRRVVREVRDFLRDLAMDLPDVFPAPRPPRPRFRRVRLRTPRTPRPTKAQREAARALLTERTAHWAAVLGLKYNRIAIKSQRTLWGSCSRKGNLNYNWRLADAPPAVLDYLVIHELCHLARPDHSRAFWTLVAGACPGYKAARKWLRLHGAALMAGEETPPLS